VLHRVSEWAKATVSGFCERFVVSGCERRRNRWREDGLNGYLWSVSTGESDSILHRRRAGRIIRHILGTEFEGCSAATSTRVTTGIAVQAALLVIYFASWTGVGEAYQRGKCG